MTPTLTTPYVERVVDGDAVEVMLDLGPLAEQILSAAASALGHSRDQAERLVSEQLRDFASSYASRTESAWQVMLPIAAARRLAEDLDAASGEPEVCEVGSCEAWQMPGSAYCAPHDEVLR